MATNRGKQKRAQKQKKRREVRRKQRAERRPSTRTANDVLEAEGQRDLQALCGYDADVAPDAKPWLNLDEQERIARVSRYHEAALKPGARPPAMARHAGMHVIVENQLAEGSPPQVCAAVARLMGQGMGRHDALHAVGWVLTEHMRSAMERRTPVDEEAYVVELEALSLESWLARVSGG